MDKQITRDSALRPFRLVRNFFIFLGLVGGGVLGWWRYTTEIAPQQAGAQVPANNVVASVALVPADMPFVREYRLSDPASLDAAWGRRELTGIETAEAPKDALAALPIDRTHDHVLVTLAPLPPAELPPAAPDEKVEPYELEAPETPPVEDLASLPPLARGLAEAAAKLYADATRLQSAAKPGEDAYFKNQEAAGKILREARDKLDKALDIAPDAKVLLDMMQQVKLALFTANKTGNKPAHK